MQFYFSVLNFIHITKTRKKQSWSAQSAERMSLDLQVVSSNPMLGVDITLKHSLLKIYINKNKKRGANLECAIISGVGVTVLFTRFFIGLAIGQAL